MLDIQRGVSQGFVLSPVFFNIYAETFNRGSLEERDECVNINGTISLSCILQSRSAS